LEIINTEKSGFPSDQIHAVYEDNLERLWMPSDISFICFEQKTNNFQTFTVADPCQEKKGDLCRRSILFYSPD
jgi:hypothetical protein